MDYTKILAQMVKRKTTTELARRKMSYFVDYTNQNFEAGRHHELLFAWADDVLYGRRKRVMISLPPRHSKSEIFSVRLAAMFLGLYPEKQIIHVSHSAMLSNKFSREVRAIVRDDWRYKRLFPETLLHPDRQRVDDWKTTLDGGMKSLGVGGGVTGHGGHLLILDDIVKEGDENSPDVLQGHFEWYNSALRTRLMPGGSIIIPMTRWHTRDIVGSLIALAERNPDAEQWEVLELPAIALEDDPLGREPGEALWPEWFDKKDLKAIEVMSPRYWNALYQQQPLDELGKLFERHGFNRFTVDVEHDEAGVWTFDLALSKDESADNSCWGRWHYVKELGGLYVQCLARRHEKWPIVKEEIKSLILAYVDDYFAFPKNILELQAVQELKHEMPEHAHRIVEVSMKGAKEERAAVYAARVASGRVFVEEGQAGDDFINEHDMFPGIHDDYVDMSSVAAHYFGLKQEFKIISGYSEDEQEVRRLLKREHEHQERQAIQERLGHA